MSGKDSPHSPATVLVLAASRRGSEDPVARLQNQTHKCLVKVKGVAMIERVVQTLIDSGRFGRILISIESEEPLRQLASTRTWLEQGTIEVVPSAENLADSVLDLAQRDDSLLPLVITTADNTLHTPELIRDFMSHFERSSGDVAVAVTPEKIVLSEYPNAGIGFFRFRDGGYSFCNLYGIRTVGGLNAAEVFRTGGQFRKRPRRILDAFGLTTLLLYKTRMLRLENFFERIADRFGIAIDTIHLPYAFGPIDVDNAKSFALSERTLELRRG